jgi:hypothetical protein
MKSSILSLIALLLLNACNHTNPIKPSPPSGVMIFNDTSDLTDENVFQAVYSNYKSPPGFYQDSARTHAIYYESSLSILPSTNRKTEAFELSTNVRDQAFAWSESSSVNSSYYRNLVSERQTDKFFEFTRVYQQHPSDTLFSRVHKLTYLDRSMYNTFNWAYDSFHGSAMLGIFNARPIDTVTTLELGEYLWFLQDYQSAGAKALLCFANDFGDRVDFTLYHTVVYYGDFGVQDQILLFRSVVHLAKLSGNISLTVLQLRTIPGHNN